MNKKVFPGILLSLMLLMSLVILSGGCGRSHNNSFSSSNESNNANSALNGAWLSLNNGRAVITRLNAADEDLPEEVLEQLAKLYPESYEIYQENTPAESVSANVSSVTAIFEDSNISESSGSAKLTAVIIVNYDDKTLPLLLNGVKLTTTRTDSNTWTADISGYEGSLTLAMSSEGSMTLSGTITYIDHDWEFSTVINKSTGDELPASPGEILAGVWKFDNTETGAYVSDSGMLSNITPEDIDVSLAFGAENNSVTSMAASYYVTLNSARTALDNEANASSSKFMSIMTTSGALTQISGNLYKFTDKDSNETLIFIEDSEKIYVFTSDSESESESESESNGTAFMYMPMTKSSGFDIESLMGKSWSASGSTNGGGYVHFTNLENSTDPIKKALANLPYILKSFSLSFSDVNMNNDSTVAAKVNLSSVFTLTSELFKQILNQDDLDMDSLEINSEQHTLNITGNILKLTMNDDGEEDVIYVSFISDSKALLTIEMSSTTNDEYDGTAKFTAVLTAN